MLCIIYQNVPLTTFCSAECYIKKQLFLYPCYGTSKEMNVIQFKLVSFSLQYVITSEKLFPVCFLFFSAIQKIYCCTMFHPQTPLDFCFLQKQELDLLSKIIDYQCCKYQQEYVFNNDISNPFLLYLVAHYLYLSNTKRQKLRSK